MNNSLLKVYIMVISGVTIIILLSIYISLLPKPDEVSKASIYKVNITSIKISDEFGSPLRSIKANRLILIQAEVINLQNITQPFVYIVKVSDQDGIVYSISYNKSELAPNDRVSVANSWIPPKAGEYIISIFLWEDTNGKVLSPKRSITINVE